MPDRATPALDSLDIPDWERRATVRRQDDRSLIQKCRTLASDVSKLLGIATILIGAVAAMAGLMGLRIAGPPEDIRAIATRQDSLDRRVGRLEQGAVVTHQQLGDLASDVRFLSYLSCVKDAGQDARAVAGCRDIIRAVRGAAGGSP